MSWWKRTFGLHPVDMVMHAFIGGFLVGAIDEISRNDAATLLATAAVFAVYAWRRHRAIEALAAAGMTSGEVRSEAFHAQADELHDLQGRVMELEERLDFTERMLAQAKPDGALPPGRP